MLIITHSSRVFRPDTCSVQHFAVRYGSPERLVDLPAFEQLRPLRGDGWGAMSFHRVSSTGKGETRCRSVGHVTMGRRIQHAVWVAPDRLLVCFEESLEVWRSRLPHTALQHVDASTFETERSIGHPHLSGLHTVAALPEGRALVTASAPDALMIVRWTDGEVQRMLRMPEAIYGTGYAIDDSRDLRDHYVHNDLQTTHINSAGVSADGRRAAVSALIPGCVGEFDLDTGEYKELLTGLRGCHGARYSRTGDIYFADSCAGVLCFIDGNGRLERRFAVDSRWLHDVLEIGLDRFVFVMGDRNEFRIVDIDSGRTLHSTKYPKLPARVPPTLAQPCLRLLERMPQWMGNSVQFASVA